jgi:hypothetical protein
LIPFSPPSTELIAAMPPPGLANICICPDF